MSQKTLSITLKFIDAIMVACCCGMAFYVMPQLFASGANAGAPLGGVVAAAIVSAGPVAIGVLAWFIFVNICLRQKHQWCSTPKISWGS